ncbi:hypothetical protein [Nakamurella panacisegetis]|nr:hypothetical protein [Nakamurella panacisegetis]
MILVVLFAPLVVVLILAAVFAFNVADFLIGIVLEILAVALIAAPLVEHDRAEGIRRQMWLNAAGREVGATKQLGDYGPVIAG